MIIKQNTLKPWPLFCVCDTMGQSSKFVVGLKKIPVYGGENSPYRKSQQDVVRQKIRKNMIGKAMVTEEMNTGYSTQDYAYELPQELIAQDPLEDRSASRMLVLDRKTGTCSHRTFQDIVSYLNPGDCLVLNDTKVIPARLIGIKKETGAQIEVLLLKRKTADDWECLVRPGKKLKPGAELVFGEEPYLLTANITEIAEEGNRIIRFHYDGVFEEVLDALGEMPLPPYITHKLKSRDRYQTVYARYEGSAAAPTAGLHFTRNLLSELEMKGIRLAYVTLHVGLGTFRPVKVTDVREHHMHAEWYSVSKEAADIINKTKQAGGRVICVGTTSCRTVESAAQAYGEKIAGDLKWLAPCSEDTSIFIYPGFQFRVMDGLITNFHLPESTLIMLVSAFAGREQVLAAYQEAVKERYRFFSFGDAMLII